MESKDKRTVEDINPENIQSVSQTDSDNEKSVQQSIQDVLEAAPEELRPMIENTFLRITQYSGMMPHQEMMSAYERLQPGATDRCIKIAESIVDTNNQALLISVNAEAEGVHDIKTSRKRGQWMVFILFLVFGLLSFFAVLKGNAWAGVTMFALLAGIGGVLIYKDRREEKTIQKEEITRKI